MQVSIPEIMVALGGEAIVNRRVENTFDLIDLVNAGLPMESAKYLQEKLGFSNRIMSHLLAISESTYQRRIRAKSFLTKDETEKAISLSELYAKGLDIFGNSEKLQYWLDNPNYALGNRRPVDLLDSTIGRQEAMEILFRIQYGIYS
jgi:putative toxin-antitoxin system antitoxin component (TIGR02293 family)